MKPEAKIKSLIGVGLICSVLAIMQGSDYHKDIAHNKASLENKNEYMKDATFIYAKQSVDKRVYWKDFDIEYSPISKEFTINAKEYAPTNKAQIALKVKKDIENITKQHNTVLSELALRNNPNIAKHGKSILELAELDMLHLLDKPVRNIAFVVFDQKSVFKWYKIEHVPTDFRYVIQYKDGTKKISSNIVNRINNKEFIAIPNYFNYYGAK